MLVREKLQEREHFSDIDCAIADYILKRQEELKEDSVRQIARKLFVAPSTIIRFCQKMGYQGFNDFRDDYLKEVHYLSSHFQCLDPNFPFERGDREIVAANKIETLYEEILRDCAGLLDEGTLKKAVDMIDRAPVIYVCSLGAQSGVASIFQEKMMKVGKMVCICFQTGEGFYQACYCQKDSVFILISYTGETDKVIKIGKKAKERHLPSIAITSYGNNSLSDLCSCSLYVSTREKLIRNLGNFGVNVSVMYLLDILYAGYFNRDYDRHFEDKIRYSIECEDTESEWGRHSDNPILEG